MEPYPREWPAEAGLQGSSSRNSHPGRSCFHSNTVSRQTGFGSEQEAVALLPAIVFDHVGKLNDEFPFLIFLTAFKGVFLGGKVETGGFRKDSVSFSTSLPSEQKK